MYLSRTRADRRGEHGSRILVSNDPVSGWIDLRKWISLRLQRRAATPRAAWSLAETLAPSSMAGALACGEAFWDEASNAVQDNSGDAHVDSDIQLTNALDPTSYRDFMTFEGHFSYGYKWQNKPVPEVMYELPISYCGNPSSFIGTGETVGWPAYSRHMDYELELGIVIGKPGTNLTPETALDHVAGLTILNDFSARDIQAREMPGGLGPSKGKHFACGAGPYLTTLDSLPTDGLTMQAFVNGELWSEGNSSEMIWSIAEVVAWTSQAEKLEPGMLLGSGTCNNGCTLELGKTLRPGDTVDLRITGLGTLVNTLGDYQSGGWIPQARTPSL